MGNKPAKPGTNPIVPVEMPPPIQERLGMRENEVEVFRITPTSGQCYEHAEYTRMEGVYPDERYYFHGKPEYVGKHIRDERIGSGNGGKYFSLFDNNGTINTVEYTYAGHTCFKEVSCWTNGGKRRRHKSKRARRTRRKNSRKY